MKIYSVTVEYRKNADYTRTITSADVVYNSGMKKHYSEGEVPQTVKQFMRDCNGFPKILGKNMYCYMG